MLAKSVQDSRPPLNNLPYLELSEGYVLRLAPSPKSGFPHTASFQGIFCLKTLAALWWIC
ncbi:hypothetical protein XM38_048930 [Halomicronema hongdechloris C2206]|uniref:Uncharacterized protein n=1 Tax=Halomicronema hongdechloris C2206 TaxID=1641165 RepID=A0A1Z3HUE6_9CYAN|nr:hypothetical protein XM38_048930 [Halomicronema hongdechloris C2206]